MYKAEFVVTENNKKPFIEFISLLNDDERADIYSSIELLCELKNQGLRIPEKLSKYLRNGIFELRVNHKSKISRNLYFFVKGQKIIFTHGFIKKTDKVPNKEIKKAESLMKKYMFINK
jgi:phage-related protein